MDTEQQSLILNKDAIKRKLRRMACEIYERNADEKALILAGINERGKVVATRLSQLLKEITAFDISMVNIHMDPGHPADVTIEGALDFNDKVVILVDDVANSGRTLLYAMKPLLEYVPLKIQTAVLVDRTHKSFPVVIDYTGHSLATTLKDSIRVQINEQEISGAYLI